MKSFFLSLAFIASASLVMANTAPTVVIQSAQMRPGTTLMDVVYRVNDPDDATVKTRALAFVDGVRSFANVLKPVTFVEGTAANLGNAIPSNVDHTLTWDVATDWNIDLGQVKFEVLAMDARGLLPIDWITIPAAGGNPALTISKDAPTDATLLNALFWQYADSDPWLSLSSGVLTGNAGSGVFSGSVLANGSLIQGYGGAYIFKRMNLDPAGSAEMSYANATARAGLLSTSNWHAISRPYVGVPVLVGWGSNSFNQIKIPAGLNDIAATSAGGNASMVLKSDGTVVAWGIGSAISIPAGLSGVTAISMGGNHALALKSDGTVVGWGSGSAATVPAGLSGVTAISAGNAHSLALKNDGTVVSWGNNYGTIPAGLSGVTAIAAGYTHSLVLKNDGTVVAWGSISGGVLSIPAGLSGVTAIAAGNGINLALKNDGTVVGWGGNLGTIPAGLSGVTAVAAGQFHSLALKSDGTVVGWGSNTSGQISIPADLNGVTAIAAGASHSLVRKAKAP